jgi:proline iminopeptidase
MEWCRITKQRLINRTIIIMRSLYSACEPYAVHTLSVDNLHHIYVEECGNSQGIPVIFVHGGPGSGCQPDHRRLFDPNSYRIILFDQRGCGRSRPLGEVTLNRTQDLISDIEMIRVHLNVRKLLLFGGSWGATLSLAYAITHPDKVLGLILRGAFLARESDLQWFFYELKRLFPQAWSLLTHDIDHCSSSTDLIDFYYSRIHGGEASLSLPAAERWSEWGRHVVQWHMGRNREQRSDNSSNGKVAYDRLLAKVKIETHYAKHRYFIAENELLDRIELSPSVPVSIVHGLFDLTCSMESAWLLHKTMPGSRLIQLQDAGHLIDEPAMISALLNETDRMREILSPGY